VTGTDLLRSVVSALDAAGIPFMLTGSVAAAWYGGGRATMDIDLVIDPNATQLDALVESLAGAETYVAREAAVEALEHRSMFNVVDTATGWKVDLIVRKSRPFSRSEFERRRPIEYEGTRLWVATVEDLIVAKLEWAKLGGSARQLEDVAALVRLAAPQWDQAYVDHWIAELDLSIQWREAQALAKTEGGSERE
jgi:hypothetical protein